MISMIIAAIVQILFILLIAPLAMGTVRFVKARLQGRRGASPFLPYFSLLTLCRKEMVISDVSSWVFRAVPYFVFASSFFIALVLPLVFVASVFAPFSDFLIIAGALALGSIFLVLGGLDTGSAFGGMGSSREMTIAALLEPVVIMSFATISFVTGTTLIDGMLSANINFFEPYSLLFIIALVFIALAENARYPVDNPATHLELTMVHEAMVLEYSGKYLALLEYASAIKLSVFALLIMNFLFPSTVLSASSLSFSSLILILVLSLVKILVAMSALALLESMIVKMRFYRMSEYFSIAFVVSFMAMLTALFSFISDKPLASYILFSVITLVAVVMLFGRVRLKAILRYFALSSFGIAGIALGLLPHVPSYEKKNLLLFALFTLITKVWAVPFVIKRIGHAKQSLTNLPSFMSPSKSYFTAAILMVLTYFALKNVSLVGLAEWSFLVYTAIALIVLGIAMMIVKRNIYSEIIGLLVIENGIAVFVLATVGSLPVMIEFGIFAVAVATAYVLAKLTAQIGELYGSTDTERLRELAE